MATILVVFGGIAPVGSFGFSTRIRRGPSEAPQMIPLTLAIARLIERIRLADRRMTAPS
jgi:hypothetical protein